jgi:hypothetical protein
MAVTNIDTTGVTAEQIDRCTRVVDPHTMEAFYLVLSESQDLVEYKVTYVRLPSKHYTCTCPAGLNGFANCRDGVCKHIKWALKAAEEFKAELAARAAKEAKLGRISKMVESGLTHIEAVEAVEMVTTLDDAARVRVIKADKAKRRKAPAPRDNNRAFSLYR